MRTARQICLWSLLSIFFIAALPLQTLAFHAPPWDTGHQSFQPDIPPNDPTNCDKCNSTGSPFVAATGAYTTSAQDFFIPGRMPLEITRIYHGRDRYNGLLGHGWVFTYGIKVIEVTDEAIQSVTIRRANGQRDRFVQNPDGTYTNPADVFQTLIKNADDTFNLIEKDKTTLKFDVSGNLISITDRNGNSISN